MKSINIGKAGELRVRSELILRGLAPAVFDQDTGVDIILANGKRLQVKTCLKPQNSPSSYSYKYSFSIRTLAFRGGVKGLYTRKYTRTDYSDCDYFVFWLVEDNIFYIIPEAEIGAKVSFCIPTPVENRKYRIYDRKVVSKYEKYKNAWDLLA